MYWGVHLHFTFAIAFTYLVASIGSLDNSLLRYNFFFFVLLGLGIIVALHQVELIR